MGAITGRPSRNELQKNLENHRNAGIDQFLIYPRSGLEVEYMGPEWLEICRHIIEYCSEHDMAVWLYDEYNWPTGKCKGKVIKTNPDFASKKLVAFADRNFCGIENPDAPAEDYFWTEISIPLYADFLNPDAVDCFIKSTHEVYYSHFAKYFGPTIKGIFSDEPSFMYATFQEVNGSTIELPYYKGLKEDYHNATGRELISDLDSYLKGKPAENMWYMFYSLLGQRFINVAMDKMRSWCDAHNVLFTGHLMREPYPIQSIQASGRPIDAIRSFSMPGLDEIASCSRFENVEWNTFKLLESAINGPRTEALAELFAFGPSDMSLAKMRKMIYIAAIHGVNHFVTAVSALDARGNVEKALYYNPVGPTQPWAKYMSILNDAAAKAAELTRKNSTAAIALRYPQKLYCEKCNHKFVPELKIDYTKLIRSLINAQWEFRIIGDDEKAGENYQVIFELNNDGAIEEISGTRFNDISELLVFLEQTMKRKAYLRFEDGSLVEKILLKSYDDGTVCIVNTSREYLRGVTLGKEHFDMPPRDVAILPKIPQPGLKKVLDLRTVSMSAHIKNMNSMRCIFPSSRQLKIEVENDVEVRLALRQYNGIAETKLDEKLIDASSSCNVLPEGLRQLYKESAPFTLTRGCHILEVVRDVEDLPYLPLVFLFGHFALDKDRIISQLPIGNFPVNSYFKDNLTEFTGTAAFSLDNADLSEYDGIAFDHEGMALELFIDGKSLGPRLWAPFTWKLSEKQRKTDSKVEILITTSVGPLFGNYPENFKDTHLSFWPGTEEDF